MQRVRRYRDPYMKRIIMSIKNIPWAKHFSRQAVNDIVMALETQYFIEGSSVVEVGASSNNCYLLLNGRVEVALPSGLVVCELTPGSVFNYQGFVNMSSATSISGTESMFEIKCKTPCLLGEITLEELLPLMVKHWDI